MSPRQWLQLGALLIALAAVGWGSVQYVGWQRDRQEAAVVASAVHYAVEQFSPAYLAYLRKNRQAPRDNLDLALLPPRDALWTGLSRAEIYPNGDLHLEYPVSDTHRHPLLVWHIDGRENLRGGPRVCGARDIPARVLAWNGLDCDGEVAVPAKDAPIPALRALALPARPVSPMDEVLEAVHKNDATTLGALREAGRDLCATSPENFTALGEAARGNQTQAIPALANACPIDQIEPFSGRTALMIAVGARNAETVHALLAAGADPKIRTPDGDSAWFILGAESDDTSLMIRNMLLASGANIDALAADQSTLLMRAAGGGNATLAGWLLQGGAQIDLQDLRGRSAAMYAALSPHGDLPLRILVSRKANLALHDADGKTAWALAQQNPDQSRRREIIQILRTAGIQN
jgi:ankyrin repeat protein